MKTKYSALFIVIVALSALLSCSAPYSISTTSPKMISDWTVTSIEPEGDIVGMQIPAPVFNDATISCLTTSNWSLFDGGGGTYRIKPSADSTCTGGIRKITWEVINLSKTAHYFQFFRFQGPPGILSDRFTLFIMEITQMTKNTMVLKYPVKYHDKTGSLVFTFTKGK